MKETNVKVNLKTEKKKMMELNNYLNEKKAELDRYTIELESLQKVEA